jgi:hypothetical protein
MTSQYLFFGALVLTSIGAYLYGSRRHRVSARGLLAAAGWLLECAGLAVTFALLNVAAGVVLVAGSRLAGARFVSLHVLNSSVLLVLSASQAIIYQAWRKKV